MGALVNLFEEKPQSFAVRPFRVTAFTFLMSCKTSKIRLGCWRDGKKAG
jgi:hypothetical protein